MTRTGINGILTGLAALIACMAGCSSMTHTPDHTPLDPGMINHVVLITLNDPSDAAELRTDCDEMLSRIP